MPLSTPVPLASPNANVNSSSTTTLSTSSSSSSSGGGNVVTVLNNHTSTSSTAGTAASSNAKKTAATAGNSSEASWLNDMPWFHGNIRRDEAEELLNPGKSCDGLFLVRESTNFKGDYTLCVVYQQKVEHYRVIAANNQLTCLLYTSDAADE